MSETKLTFDNILKQVMLGESLDQKTAEDSIDLIATGEVSEIQIAAFLTALTMKGETVNDVKGESVNEITGFARAMREKSLVVPHSKKKPLIDLCGTGGDGLGTFNISTTTSFVVAGCGLAVSKHGNRAVTSKCGSADVLEELGVNINLTPKQVGKCLDEVGIAFLFAPNFHPVMKFVMPVRKSLGFRTVFNILGPLLSPVKADFQLMGVFDPYLTEKIAKVFVELGTKAGMVVHGNPLDEITLSGKSSVSEFNQDHEEPVQNYEFDPEKYGYQISSVNEIKGGNLSVNAEIIKSVLTKMRKGDPKFDIVVINSAAALKIAGIAVDFKAGIEMAEDSILSGKAMIKVEEVIEFSRQFKK